MQNIALVGLGNIGKQYETTRHNIGFLIVNAIANNYQVQFLDNFNSQFANIKIFNKNIFLLKPNTYMNKSGEAVNKLLNFYKMLPSDIIVFSDDINLQFMQIKYKFNSGDGGHNGLKNITQYIGAEFHKIKIGVDKPNNLYNISDYVLSNFTKTELTAIQVLQNLIINNLHLLLEKNFSSFVTNIKTNL